MVKEIDIDRLSRLSMGQTTTNSMKVIFPIWLTGNNPMLWAIRMPARTSRSQHLEIGIEAESNGIRNELLPFTMPNQAQ